MNKLISNIKTASIFIGAFLVMTSCSNDDSEDQVITQQQITNEEVQKNLEVVKASNYVDRMVLEQSFGIQNNRRTASKILNDCIEYDFDSANSYSMIFNDCDFNGDLISGKITVAYTRIDSTVSSSVTFEDFVYNDLSVNGNKTTTFTFNQEDNTCSYTVTSDLTIEKGDDFTATIKGTKNVEVVYDQDEYTRTTTGDWVTTMNDDSYTVTIDTPLVEVSSCAYIVSGIMTMTENDVTASIDYGNGECDNLATMTLPDGTVEEIEL